MNRDGHDTSQQELINNHISEYPEWQKGHQGLLKRGSLIDLTMTYYPVRKIIHTESPQDCKDYLQKNYHGKYLCGYVLTRAPTNHCMSICAWDGDVVHVMNPTPDTGHQQISWDDLEKNHNADFLMFFR